MVDGLKQASSTLCFANYDLCQRENTDVNLSVNVNFLHISCGLLFVAHRGKYHIYVSFITW